MLMHACMHGTQHHAVMYMLSLKVIQHACMEMASYLAGIMLCGGLKKMEI